MPLFNAFQQSIADVLTNQTIIADGSSPVYDQFSETKEMTIVVTISGAVTGVTPTIQFTMWNVTEGGSLFSPADSAVFTSGITPNTFLFTIESPRVQLNWTVTGTTPSFGGVYVSFISSDAFTTQAVSGTITANAGTNLNTSALLLDATFTGRINTLGQKTMAASTPIVIASNQSAIPVTQSTSPWVSNITQFGSSNVVTGTGVSGAGIPRVTISNDSSLAANQSVNLNQVGGSGITLGQKTSANSAPVVIASDQSTLPVSGTISINFPTGTLNNGAETAVAAVAIQVLAANANRNKMIIQNTGAASVRVGATGVTATTGMRLAAGTTLVMDNPECPTNAIFAIREGAVSSIVLAQEVV